MTGHELRSQYLEFFRSQDSLVIPSASLIPTDPTTLLTSAGMQPLVPYFKAEEVPPARRLVSCQKCCRADDIEQVGVTWRHASFFEMLGNFSFGDYFKRDAIVWAWEFLTKTLSIDPKLLWVSVYHEDADAPEIWKRDVGLSDDRIYRFDKKDNWWGPVGASGPCGPDSEIFFDRGSKYDTGDPELDRPGGDGDRYGELWNLVFQQYNQQVGGQLDLLPAPGIDTGMGLERTAAVLQGVDTIHHSDLFAPIINAVFACRQPNDLTYEAQTPELNPQDPTTRPVKIIADHVRAATFMAGDGIIPGNTGRDYVMRRFVRRAYLQGRALGINEPFLHRIVPVVSATYQGVYPNLGANLALISDLIRREEARFGETIEGGVGRLDDLIQDAKKQGAESLSGAEVFDLYSTHGFPKELTADYLAEQGLTYDEAEYRQAEARHSSTSGSSVGEYAQREFSDLQTEFVGYDELTSEATIIGVRPDNETVRVVLDHSPFYAEAGGQVGDMGLLEGEGFRAQVVDTQKQGPTQILSALVLQGEAREGCSVRASVDAPRRRAIERAHSATHLLHAALRDILGNHVQQRGSLVEPDRLRFDFVHFSPMTPEEITRVERLVNEEALRSDPIVIRPMSLAEARSEGAMALFGEKYGDVVRTVKMGDFSFELCGGTHLPNTSATGLVRIVSEGGVGANLRRIEALTGLAALEYDREQESRLREVSRALQAPPEGAESAAEKLRARVRELEKTLETAQREKASGAGDTLLQNALEVNGVKLAAGRAPQGLGTDALRAMADQLSDKLGGVVVLVGEGEGKVLWAVKAAKGAVAQGAHAGNLARELAKITGGGGGGRPDFAQAGGRDVSQIEPALSRVAELLREQVS